MKRSQVNAAIREATHCFTANGWALPPDPKWDVTDFGLGRFDSAGLVLINLADEPEYCEKLMFARRGMATPAHTHFRKKEDIIVRWGALRVRLWREKPPMPTEAPVIVKRNGITLTISGGTSLVLTAGERITLSPGVWHEFEPDSEACIIGEVSTQNDDLQDNLFADPAIGRFSTIEEDEPRLVRLVSDPI